MTQSRKFWVLEEPFIVDDTVRKQLIWCGYLRQDSPDTQWNDNQQNVERGKTQDQLEIGHSRRY